MLRTTLGLAPRASMACRNQLMLPTTPCSSRRWPMALRTSSKMARHGLPASLRVLDIEVVYLHRTSKYTTWVLLCSRHEPASEGRFRTTTQRRGSRGALRPAALRPGGRRGRRQAAEDRPRGGHLPHRSQHQLLQRLLGGLLLLRLLPHAAPGRRLHSDLRADQREDT